MNNKQILVKLSIFLCLVLSFSLFLPQDSIAKESPITEVKLTLENQPQIGGIAVFKLVVGVPIHDIPLHLIDANIGCFLPEGLDLINDKNYKVVPKQAVSYPREWGQNVTFYSGPMKSGETKEVVFKVRIPDGRKYLIIAGGGDNHDSLEIDLGDPEPPELTYFDRAGADTAGIKDGEVHIKTRIKQLEKGNLTDLTIPQDSPQPPIRTELLVRTKERPYYDYYREFYMHYPSGKDILIPIRYLVYTEEETPHLKTTVTLPQGLEFINGESYKVTPLEDGRTEVLLYSGPMRFKQCKAFYFKVRRVSRQEEFPIIATSEIVTLDGKTLLKEDNLTINLRRGKV